MTAPSLSDNQYAVGMAIEDSIAMKFTKILDDPAERTRFTHYCLL